MELSEIIYDASLPPGPFALLFVALWLLAGFLYWKFMPRAWSTLVPFTLRTMLLMLLAWCLLLPMRRISEIEVLKPRFAVILDSSASMGLVPNAMEAPPRWDVVKAITAQPWMAQLQAHCQVDFWSLQQEVAQAPEGLALLDRPPAGKATALRDGLRKINEQYRGLPLTGLLLLSDGLDTRDVGRSWALDDPWPAPVFTVALEPEGAWSIQTDVRVDTVETPRRVVVGWDTTLKAAVSGQGTGGQPVEVRLYENDKFVKSETVQIPPEGGTREATFVLSHPDVGAFLYRVDATPLPGEKRTNDNSYALSVQVTDSRNRLLYVEDVPRWESKYLTRNLIANPDVSPLSFVRGPGGAFISYGQRGGMTLDLTRDQLLRFKMIILGDLDAATLTDTRAAELLTFVDEGGSLILLGGPRAWGAQGFGASPLAKLLPVKRTGYAPVMEGQFKVSITPEGLSHPAFQRQEGVEPVLPHLLSVFPGSAPAAGATVLAMADTPQGAQPVIIAQRYGQGKVAAVLTDSLWRWALAGGSDKPYARFWRQLVNWMTPQQQDADQWGLELTADRERLFDGESLTLNAKLFGMDGLKDLSAIRMHCEVTRPDGNVLSYTMDRAAVTGAAAQVTFTLPFTPDQGGLFRAVAKTELDGRRMESGPYAFFLNPYSPETEPKAADVELLRTISTSSQGRFCATQEDLAAVLRALEHQGIDEERVRFVSLWNTWVVMALILLALVTEWFWRQKRNLV